MNQHPQYGLISSALDSLARLASSATLMSAGGMRSGLAHSLLQGVDSVRQELLGAGAEAGVGGGVAEPSTAGPRFYYQEQWAPGEREWFSALAKATGFDIRARHFDFGDGVAFCYQPVDQGGLPENRQRQGMRWHVEGTRYAWPGWPPVDEVAKAVAYAWKNKPRRNGLEILQDREYDLGFILDEIRTAA